MGAATRLVGEVGSLSIVIDRFNRPHDWAEGDAGLAKVP